jgi:phosphatidylglycerophosphatase C
MVVPYLARVTDSPAGFAAFDFDGTISRRDTFLPFLQRLCGAQRVFRALARAAGPSRLDRNALKDAVLVRLLAGRRHDDVVEAGADYARFLREDGRLRPDALARIEEHRALGHTVVVVSASPEVYLTPLATLLGVDDVLATRLEVADDGLLTGRMLGLNCRGPEKVARLDAWLDGRVPARLWAYGNSTGDRELLARADVGLRIRSRSPFPPLP